MKNTILLVLAFTAALHADLSVNQIEQMVFKIHEKRAGADLKFWKQQKSHSLD